MYPPQALCRCGDCKLFGSLVSQPNACSWGVPECNKGADSTHADRCPLFTYPNGYQPLLDCAEEDLPEWTRTEQMTLEV